MALVSGRTLAQEFERRYRSGRQDSLERAARMVRLPRYRAADCAPSTVRDMLRHYSETREILVWAGASESTVWGHPRGNYLFRAFHDWAHIRTGASFSVESEVRLARFQAAETDSSLLAVFILEEVAEQARYFEASGAFLDGAQIEFAAATIDRLIRN